MKFLLKIIACLFLFPFSISVQAQKKYKVGMLVMATGKYTVFLEELFKSADKYFLSNQNVTYFVFTDGQVSINTERPLIKIHQDRLGWPYDTMMRFKVYEHASDWFEDFDYLFAIDADMLFVDKVGEEILGERVATRHPGFLFEFKNIYEGHMYDRQHDYDQYDNSTACIKPGDGQYYFAGGFYGGSTLEFLKMAITCTNAVKKDLENNYIAKNNDESHLNRYFIDNKPTVILSPSYCYPESWHIPFTRKLLALDKNHSEFQTPK